jgi:hypothetical protein
VNQYETCAELHFQNLDVLNKPKLATFSQKYQWNRNVAQLLASKIYKLYFLH